MIDILYKKWSSDVVLVYIVLILIKGF